MFKRQPATAMVTDLIPLTAEEIKLYRFHNLGKAAVRLQIIAQGVGRNRQLLLERARTTDELIEGLSQGCPYLERETTVRDLRSVLVQFLSWMPDAEERWFPRVTA